MQETHLRLLKTQPEHDSVHSAAPDHAGDPTLSSDQEPRSPAGQASTEDQLVALLRAALRAELKAGASARAQAPPPPAPPNRPSPPPCRTCWPRGCSTPAPATSPPRASTRRTSSSASSTGSLRHRGFAQCGPFELRQFLVYLREGHTEPGGRWGIPRLTAALRPVTCRDYYITLHAFFA